MKGMGRRGWGKQGFNRAWADAACAEHRRQMSHKCPWYGSSRWVAAWWYPSSKLCSACRAKKAKLSRSARVFHCGSCGLEIDRDLNAAKDLAALAELAYVCLLAQLMTGEPVDWSQLPVRPDGWELASTRSSRGCARAGARSGPGDGGRGRPPVLAKTGTPPLIGKRPSRRHLPLKMAIRPSRPDERTRIVSPRSHAQSIGRNLRWVCNYCTLDWNGSRASTVVPPPGAERSRSSPPRR